LDHPPVRAVVLAIATLAVALATVSPTAPPVVRDAEARAALGTMGSAVPLDTVALEASVRDEMRATRTPGVAIAVVMGDSVVYAKGFGVASIETGAPVTSDMLFRVGSVTKMFTGLTAVMLSHAGKVDLHARIGRYAKGLHESPARVTLDQLLSHTGGITNEAAGDGPHDDAALGVRAVGMRPRWRPDVESLRLSHRVGSRLHGVPAGQVRRDHPREPKRRDLRSNRTGRDEPGVAAASGVG
jgi:CubicO group peptidase (beta-lactamase class C family)